MSESIKVGNIVEGTIVQIRPFGAIVSLPPNSHGLVHISHISGEFVKDINSYVSVGEAVKVKVLSIDNDKRKISLSMKEATAEPEKKPEKKPEAPVAKPYRKVETFAKDEPITFEDKLKDFLKNSNNRQAILNKRNKKR